MCGLLDKAISKRLVTEKCLTFKCAVMTGVATDTEAKDTINLYGEVPMEIRMNELLDK